MRPPALSRCCTPRGWRLFGGRISCVIPQGMVGLEVHLAAPKVEEGLAVYLSVHHNDWHSGEIKDMCDAATLPGAGAALGDAFVVIAALVIAGRLLEERCHSVLNNIVQLSLNLRLL